MNKVIVSLACASALISGVMAEESGVFVGLEAGLGDFKAERTVTQQGTDTEIASGGRYGLTLGYKRFFTPRIGLRYYANVSFNNFSKQGDTVRLTNYGANVDFLGNFIATESVSFGGFIGIGLGGNAWHNRAFPAIKALATTFNKNGFDLALNVGLRTNLFTHHGIEIALRMPLFANNIVEGATTGRLDYENTYNVVARYIFSF